MKLFKFDSIRNKIVFTIAIVAIVATLLTTATFAILEAVQFKDTLNTELESTSRIIATHSAAALEFGDPDVASETLKPLSGNNRIAAAYILDKDGNVFAGYVRNDLNNIFSAKVINQNIPSDKNYIVAKNPVSLSGKEIGSIYIVSDFAELRSRFTDNLLILLITFVLISFLVFLSSMRIEGLISTPILRLARVANSISLNKDYTKRADKNTDDEIGRLVDSFNEMIGEIQKRDEELESKVRERTRDLENEVKERKRAEEELKFKTEYENIIIELSNNFINLPHEKIDQGINNVLKEISVFSGAERCSVFQFDAYKTSLKCTHRWAETQEKREIKESEIINYKSLQGLLKNTQDGEIVKINNPGSKTSLYYEDILELKNRGIKSFISVPLFYSDSILGFVSFESLSSEVEWPEFTIPLLQISGEMLVNALKRKEVLNQLKESRMMLRTVIDNIPQAIFWKNRKSVYLGCNNTFAEYAGIRDTSDIAGLTDYDLPWSKSQTESYLESEQRVIFTGYPEYRVVQSQKQHQKEAESIIEVNRIPLFDSQGSIIGILGTYEDITERKVMEEELIKNQKLESLGTLAGGIAHDFNNLLTAILGSISLAKTELSSGKLTNKRLEVIEQTSQRAKDLTFQLLTFAKGGEPLMKIVDISELLRETTMLALRGANVNYKFLIDQDLWPVRADEGQISQAVNNLVLNASQSMDNIEGGTVSVFAKNVPLNESDSLPLEPGKYVKVAIEDEGCGIEQGDFTKIFDPYFTNRKEGHGLGLASTHSIIEKHGGFISFDSAVNKGSSFYFYLPAFSGISVESENKEFAGEMIKGNGHILIMDDEKIIRDVAGEILKNLGYDVELAEDGRRALEKFRQAKENGNPFDAVILDLTVPGGLGGMETLEHMKNIDAEVKAIVSSGYSNDPIMSEYKNHGFIDAVPKPYRADFLAEVLNRILSS